VAAVDTEGHKWKAEGRRYSRLLTHLFVLSMAAPGVSMTVASAHQAPSVRQRVSVVQAAAIVALNQRDVGDQPPAPDPVPSPSAAPTPAVKPVVRHIPPAPKPVAIPYDKQAVANLIRAAAARYGANAEQLLRVAMCESHLNWNSYNASSGATGLFQFKPATFRAHGGHNIWDAAEQADIAAKMFSQGLAYEWACK
jgi:hypothetical protein